MAELSKNSGFVGAKIHNTKHNYSKAQLASEEEPDEESHVGI